MHEHQGRSLHALHGFGKAPCRTDIEATTKSAAKELAGSHFKDAAELYHAAEHFSLGVITSEKGGLDVSKALEESLEDESLPVDHALAPWQECGLLNPQLDLNRNGKKW